MNIFEIAQKADEIEDELRHRGFTSPDLDIVINYTSGCPFKIRLNVSSFNTSIYETWSAYENTPEAFSEIWESCLSFIANLEEPEKLRRKDFLKKVGNLVDEGRELGIATEVMTPLEATFEAMQSNLLEGPK